MAQRRLVRLLVLAGAFVLVAVAAAIPLWSGGLKALFAQAESTGVKLEIIDGRVSDNTPVVVFKLTDNAGNALKLSDLDANSPRFTIILSTFFSNSAPASLRRGVRGCSVMSHLLR